MKHVLVYLYFSITPDTTLLLGAMQWSWVKPALVSAAPASQGTQKQLLFDSLGDCQKELDKQALDQGERPAPNQWAVPVCVPVPHPTN